MAGRPNGTGPTSRPPTPPRWSPREDMARSVLLVAQWFHRGTCAKHWVKHWDCQWVFAIPCTSSTNFLQESVLLKLHRLKYWLTCHSNLGGERFEENCGKINYLFKNKREEREGWKQWKEKGNGRKKYCHNNSLTMYITRDKQTNTISLLSLKYYGRTLNYHDNSLRFYWFSPPPSLQLKPTQWFLLTRSWESSASCRLLYCCPSTKSTRRPADRCRPRHPSRSRTRRWEDTFRNSRRHIRPQSLKSTYEGESVSLAVEHNDQSRSGTNRRTKVRVVKVIEWWA